jgi:hypothetical protein
MNMDQLREKFAQTAYERDAKARWGAAYFTPWDHLHEAVRTHYWDAQQWIMLVIDEYLASNAGRLTFRPPLLDDGFELFGSDAAKGHS